MPALFGILEFLARGVHGLVSILLQVKERGPLTDLLYTLGVEILCLEFIEAIFFLLL